jgi:hypothetical protein
MKQKLLVFLLALPMLLLTGCKSLDPAGPYGGDQVLYSADLTISTSYDVVHTFVSWEYRNRTALASTPQIHEYADLMRSNYPTYHRAAMSARMVYANSKTKPNQTALALTLDVLREAVRQANQWLANATNVPSPLEVTR